VQLRANEKAARRGGGGGQVKHTHVLIIKADNKPKPTDVLIIKADKLNTPIHED
jgi:hypothetical protein